MQTIVWTILFSSPLFPHTHTWSINQPLTMYNPGWNRCVSLNLVAVNKVDDFQKKVWMQLEIKTMAFSIRWTEPSSQSVIQLMCKWQLKSLTYPCCIGFKFQWNLHEIATWAIPSLLLVWGSRWKVSWKIIFHRFRRPQLFIITF